MRLLQNQRLYVNHNLVSRFYDCILLTSRVYCSNVGIINSIFPLVPIPINLLPELPAYLDICKNSGQGTKRSQYCTARNENNRFNIRTQRVHSQFEYRTHSQINAGFLNVFRVPRIVKALTGVRCFLKFELSSVESGQCDELLNTGLKEVLVYSFVS